MKSSKKAESDKVRQIRLLPAIIIAVLQLIVWLVIPRYTSGGIAMGVSFFGAILGALAIIIWWLFFSRAKRQERWVSILLMMALLALMHQFTHESIKTGLSGLMYYFYAVPVLTLSFVLWATFSSKMSGKARNISMILTIFLACGIWALFRSNGITGNARALFKWRWAKTNEEILLSKAEETPMIKPGTTTPNTYWTGFRGANRDGVVYRTRIQADWNESPPVELWRHPIGPGCSSFAVRGSMVYTQEQLGENEIVSCYDISTGEPFWKHYDKARFWDSHAGAGPRSTPTLYDSLVCTLGATGILNMLDASDGTVVWSRNAAEDIEAILPGWGFASSPLIVDSTVIVAISGTLVAYNIENGALRWLGPKGGENYSSPHLAVIDGIKQVIMMGQFAASSFLPQNGKILWEWQWEGGAIIQPAFTANGDILISEGYRKGIHRITVSHNSGKWNIKEHWMTKKIRPDFNDIVIHKGYMYGFEGLSLTCIDLTDGNRKWKEGRYGGQLLLLADQDLLLLISEKGELIMAKASPDQLTEVSHFKAIEGKTWNHPVLVNDILLVRNTQEMAAFRLPTLH